MRNSLIVLSLLSAICGAGYAKPDAAASVTLKADTPSTTALGNSFIAPEGWTMERKGNAVILTAPESDSRIALIDVADAKDADAAVAAAWQAFDPSAHWAMKLASDRPPRDGWDARRAYAYEVSPNEKRSVGASALHHDKQWTVVITNFADAVAEKRAGQVAKVFDKLLPKGYSRETFAGRTPHKLDAARLDKLKQFIESSKAQFDVPGVGIGIVQDGKVVFAGGFGVRELGKPDPITADTLFMIASNTKALTTLMLAKEVDQKKFSWDTPVTQVLPTFKLGDAATTKQVLIEHLICACTGLPRQDMEWLFTGRDTTPEMTMATLGGMQPTSKFGALFQYSNLMAAAAGFTGGHVAYPGKELGAAYDAAMQSLVFDPLGMRDTTFDYARALAGNHASPHSQDVDDHTVPASMDINDTIVGARPAGAAWSNVNDLLRYVQMELAQGTLPDGSRYIGKDALLERRKQKVAIGNNVSYGMGLMVDRTWGVPVVHHGGDMVGFHSDMMWLPDANVGAVILTNSDLGVNLRGPFQRKLLEVLFDGNDEAAGNLAAAVKLHKDAFAVERKRLQVPADAAQVGKLAKLYRNDKLGDIHVTRDGAHTWFEVKSWKSEVATRKNDDGSLSFETISPGVADFEFTAGTDPSKRQLVLRDGQHEYGFSEVK